MATFVETMKEYVDKARARLAAAEQVHRAASAELMAASSDFAVWNNAYTLAVKEREKWEAEAKETQQQLPMDLPDTTSLSFEPSNVADEHNHSVEINKTAKVREVLAAHQTGITPGQLWLNVKDFQVSRAYLYSVLKRFRDNDEVTVRRGKYMLKPKPIEAKPIEGEALTIQ